MLFACSGIPVPSRRSREELTSFVTSANLARAFNEHRNRDDNLTVGAANHCALRFACLFGLYYVHHFTLFIQMNCGHCTMMCCFYHYRLQCAFLIIQLLMGS